MLFELCYDDGFLLQVQAGKDRTLFSVKEGYVKYTSDLLEIHPNKLKLGEEQFQEKKFVNVIENPRPVKFVLVKDT